MDLSAFASPDFNVKNWINLTYRSIESNENPEVVTSNLTMKLQSALQQVNIEMEQTSNNLVHNSPRIIRDVEILTEEALVLKEKMNSVKQEIAEVEKNTGQSMKSLEKIDRIKMEFQKARQALHEADNWTILCNEFESAFDSGEVQAAATKLVSLQQSLKVLSKAPDYEDKRLQLDQLKNRLEAQTSYKLVEAFNLNSIENSKRYADIYTAIDRKPQLLNYYAESQKTLLRQQWDELLDLKADDTVMEILHNYYDILLQSWTTQFKLCDKVFNTNMSEVLVTLYTSLLKSLAPHFSKLIDDVSKSIMDPITFLCQVKNETKRLADNFRSLLATALFTSDKNQVLLELIKAIYLPYVNHVSKYGDYEQALMYQLLSELKDSQEEVSDSIEVLMLTNSQVFDIALQSLKRCQQFTEGCGYRGLCKALEHFFNNYINRYKQVLNEIDKRQGRAEVFSMFQVCLAFLQNLGDFMNHVQQIDTDIVSSMRQVSVEYSKDIHPFLQWPRILLNDLGFREFTRSMDELSKNDDAVVLKSTSSSLHKLCQEVHHTTFKVIFSPISIHFESLKSAPVWTQVSLSNDLPDYSIIPQEYITQIGQYLMTLPQHLEPFLSTENPALNLALSLIGSEQDSLIEHKSDDRSFADIFLGNVSSGTCKTYCEEILGISEISGFGCKQLCTDIEYLGNVLEDLGFNLSDKLKNIAELLKIPAAEYGTQTAINNPPLVSAIRSMRKITSE